MIRVLHVLGGLDRGGAETMVMNLYRAIDRSKIQFDFVIHTMEKQAYYDEIISLGGRVYNFPQFKGVNIFSVMHNWTAFFKKHPEYDVLHSHVRSYASVYLPIAKRFGLKTIIHSHSTSNGNGFTSFVKRIMQLPLRYQADYLISCSQESGEWLYGKRACRKNNYLLFPNAIDVEKYRYSLEVESIYRAQLNLEGKFIIGHIGRFHKAKNHVFILDIFADVCTKIDNAVLLLIGDGPLRESITSKIRKLGIEDRVIFLGSRDDIYKLLSVMNIFIFPSLWEGLPLAVIEAQASGVRCLISDCIASDVDISELVTRLPIDDFRVWSKMILTINTSRLDVNDKIKASCFDVITYAENFKKLYLKIVN